MPQLGRLPHGSGNPQLAVPHAWARAADRPCSAKIPAKSDLAKGAELRLHKQLRTTAFPLHFQSSRSSCVRCPAQSDRQISESIVAIPGTEGAVALAVANASRTRCWLFFEGNGVGERITARITRKTATAPVEVPGEQVPAPCPPHRIFSAPFQPSHARWIATNSEGSWPQWPQRGVKSASEHLFGLN